MRRLIPKLRLHRLDEANADYHFRAVYRADEIGMRARFDFDYVGAVFRQQPARFDADAADPEVQHAQACEWISPLSSVGTRRLLRDGR